MQLSPSKVFVKKLLKIPYFQKFQSDDNFNYFAYVMTHHNPNYIERLDYQIGDDCVTFLLQLSFFGFLSNIFFFYLNFSILNTNLHFETNVKIVQNCHGTAKQLTKKAVSKILKNKRTARKRDIILLYIFSINYRLLNISCVCYLEKIFR